MSLSVGIIRTRYLGDVILLVPLIREIRAFDPEARIGVVLNAGTTYPLERLPGVSLLPMATSGSIRRLSSTLFLAREVRRSRFDLLFDLTVSDRSRLISRLSGAGRTGAAGAAADRRAGGPWEIYLPVDLNVGPEPVTVQHGKLFRALGIPVSGRGDKAYPPDPRWTEEADRFLGRTFPGGRPVLFLHPGGRHWFKRWPPDRFARLADRWIARTGGGVVVAGSASERTLVESVLSGTVGTEIIPLVGAPIGLLDALIRRATVFVGSDSGPLHMADAAHVPLVGLFGSTSPAVWGPTASSRREVVYRSLPCSPCDHTGCSYGEKNCLASLPVEEVYDRVERLLS
ncbi:MAG: glycosyltransferase family 9 protein [Nitrospirae bacterium]|nr:glycosyltransferase family 9 protein [Nitrospirota bacterium]MCL5284944.1 glycosyltransferase family 9 protein [Nitrospirota bacterium]